MTINMMIGARMVSYSRHETYAKIKKPLDTCVLRDVDAEKPGHKNSNSEQIR